MKVLPTSEQSAFNSYIESLPINYPTIPGGVRVQFINVSANSGQP